MARYRMARTDAPLQNHCVGGRIVGGDETHVEVEVPAGVEVSDALVPMGGLGGAKKKGKKKPEAEPTEAEPTEDE